MLSTFCLGILLAQLACGSSRSNSPSPSTSGPEIAITGASIDASNHVVANYTVTQNGQAASSATVASLQPHWTVAGLSVDPVTVVTDADAATGQIRPPVQAWQSYVLTGSETLTSLPIDGPGTPAAFVQTNVKQPGSETGGGVQDLGGGKFAYTFQNALPQNFDPGQTLRVGVWLGGAPGTTQTSSTFDFVPNGGASQTRELVLDANCNKCHGLLQAHGGFRTGVKLCVTCHTYQNADADTVDPAAATGATASTNPNPLDLGRLVHRIHRGNELPTLYTRSGPTQPNATRANVSPPFFPSVNKPKLGQKYSVVGFQGSETIYGQVVNRTDNNQPALAVASGVRFPQDLRNCDACHGGAAQAQQRFNDISRRTCQGCHTDAWFGDPATIASDDVHYMHPGDTQTDDHNCYGCHVPTTPAPNVDADATALHVAPATSPNWNGLIAKIVGVQNMRPGQSPSVVFTLADRDGTPTPLNAPSPATDSTSPIPRAISRVAITISGPTSPDDQTGNAPITETVPLTSTADANGQFTYAFKATVPSNATGTWAVAIEARRSAATPFYDASSDAYSWPFTGESLNEYADNPVQYVDLAAGSAPGGSAAPRRQVVSRDNCNNCHQALTAHGDLRHNVEYCVMCHTPDGTDWTQRPKGADGNVALAKTFDDIEERSIHFKVMIHRIHTGDRTGSAELELARPFVVYGFGGTPNFFDDVRFPVNLADCTLCHVNQTFAIESVPKNALATTANETATVQHSATPTHVASETGTAPITAACMGCHDTGAAATHAQQITSGGTERCADCHALDAPDLGLKAAHGLK
jgi:OmcA/MtrC family decaheme c-type cytochrome